MFGKIVETCFGYVRLLLLGQAIDNHDKLLTNQDLLSCA